MKAPCTMKCVRNITNHRSFILIAGSDVTYSLAEGAFSTNYDVILKQDLVRVRRQATQVSSTPDPSEKPSPSKLFFTHERAQLLSKWCHYCFFTSFKTLVLSYAKYDSVCFFCNNIHDINYYYNNNNTNAYNPTVHDHNNSANYTLRRSSGEWVT